MGYYDDYDSRFARHGEFHFLTPADRNPVLGDNYEFIVVSDTHIEDDAGENAFRGLGAYIGEAKFVVVTGDLTQGGSREEIGRFIAAAKTFPVPCYPVIGNHDIYDQRAAPWGELIGSSCYRVDASGGGTTLFILDNANGHMGQEQLDWFRRELQSAGERVFVFAHENFFAGGFFEPEQVTDLRERGLIMSLLKNHRGIGKMMFMGHLHRRIEGEYGGVRYVMSEAYREGRTFCRVRVSPGGVSYTFETAVP
jgi:3',5'-cyclic AMP phosphodiesterase CpdA